MITVLLKVAAYTIAINLFFYLLVPSLVISLTSKVVVKSKVSYGIVCEALMTGAIILLFIAVITDLLSFALFEQHLSIMAPYSEKIIQNSTDVFVVVTVLLIQAFVLGLLIVKSERRIVGFGKGIGILLVSMLILSMIIPMIANFIDWIGFHYYMRYLVVLDF